MCAVCRKVKESSVTPEQAEALLEELQHKLSDEHIEEVEDLVADYYDTYDYGLDDDMLMEEYDDELGEDEKQMIREYSDDSLDIDDIGDLYDDYED